MQLLQDFDHSQSFIGQTFMDEKTSLFWGHPLSIDGHALIKIRKADQDGGPVTEAMAGSDSPEVYFKPKVLSEESNHDLPCDFPLHESRDGTPSQQQCVFSTVLSLQLNSSGHFPLVFQEVSIILFDSNQTGLDSFPSLYVFRDDD